ncbi:MAG TPA: HDOD domain-containing protein [Candidatus Hydrogenedentes bacterium]|nr:HDOD domain-containing protein [Candidatus Hydrogenedentota bacterium]HOL76124.1 HDOD domain-containing protein [Candidatus Hydrogenedentota bacterium]HPO84738.1 HDOD domain-containing protein [Candidatus Hydrogenedentota bacterium]
MIHDRRSSPELPEGDLPRKRTMKTGKDHLEQIEKLAERRIGELLVEAGLIEKEDLDYALRVQAEHGGDTVRILISLGCITVDDFLRFLAGLPGIHTLDLSQCEVDPELVRRVPREVAEKYQVFPIARKGDELILGMGRLLEEHQLKELERCVGLRLTPLLCLEEDLRAAIARYYSGAEPLPPVTESDLQGLAAPLRFSLVARLLQEIDAFPALPETVARVRQAMNNPKSSIRDVSDVIIMDPPVAAKVLSVANSAAYGFPRQVQDVTLAVTLLGLRETYSIVLSVAVLNLLEKSRHLDYKRFWLEALCCAAATRFVLKVANIRNMPGAFVGGLLHDLGRVAFAETLPHLSKRIDLRVSDEELLATEERLIGISHPEAGYMLALHWELPEEIAQAIRFHHQPERADSHKEIVAVVALADGLARSSGANLEESRYLLEQHKSSLEVLQIDAEAGEAMIADFLSRRDDSLRDALL